MNDCQVCERIEQIKRGENPYFVRELETGYVVIGDYQRFWGYTVFICKVHAAELHHLEHDYKNRFLQEMALVSEGVYRAFSPDKLNYELLGVGNAVHMHWHFFPRRDGDTPHPGPVWKLAKEEMYAEKYRPDESELKKMRQLLNREFDKLLVRFR